MEQRRENRRNMCADLLTLSWTDAQGRGQSEVATLDDISATGACLELEDAIPVGTSVRLHYPNGEYRGKIKYCTFEEIGYVIGVAFDEGYRWSKKDFEPSHLLELPLMPGKRTIPV